MLKFSILGPVEVQSAGRVATIRGAFQRALLVTFLVSEGKLVMVDSLVDELWGENPPSRAENALQAHVSRLRRKLDSLEPDRTTPRLVSWPSGYRLLLDDNELDATVFTRALTGVRSHPGTEPTEAVLRLRSALALWRGPACGGALSGPICQSAAARYEESRFAALELLFDNELRIGRHAEVIAELSELVEAGSLNERFCEQLMVALYRSGRQTDALQVYRRMWARLTDQLGIEPSPTLQKYERAILAHDPMLEAPADYVALRA